MDAHTRIDRAYTQLVLALTEALEACDPRTEVQPGVFAGINLPELLAAALEQVCENADQGTYHLIRHRPGCWEASHIVALAAQVDYARSDRENLPPEPEYPTEQLPPLAPLPSELLYDPRD